MLSFLKNKLSTIGLLIQYISPFGHWERRSMLRDSSNITVDRKTWILALGAPFVECMLVEGYHDVLPIYDSKSSKKINNFAVQELDCIENLNDLDKWIDEFNAEESVLESFLRSWFQITKDKQEHAIKVVRKSNQRKAQSWEYYKTSKFDHKYTNVRLYELVYALHLTRLACFAGFFDQQECWRRLEEIADQIERRLNGITTWAEFGRQVLAGKAVDDEDDQQELFIDALNELVSNKNSIWNHVPFNTGFSIVKRNKIKPYSNLPLLPDTSSHLPTIQKLENLAHQGDFSVVLDELQLVAENANPDSDVLDEVLRIFSPDKFDVNQISKLPDRFPDNPYPLLIRARWLIDWAWLARGTSYAGDVGVQGFKDFESRMLRAWKDLEKVRSLLTDEPCVHDLMFAVLPHIEEEECGFDPDKETERLLADLRSRFPSYYSAIVHVLHFMAPRWGGSYEEAMKIASASVEVAPEDSIVPIVFFQVAIQEWKDLDDDLDDEEGDDDYIGADGNTNEAQAFLQNHEVSETLDKWFEPLLRIASEKKEHNQYILSCLSFWYCLKQDRQKLEQISDVMNPVLYDTCYWDDIYKRNFVVSKLSWLYYL